MRGLPARRIASTALCAALLVGLAGPAAVAADPARERADAGTRAPLPDADTLLAQVKRLGDLGGVLTPVTGLLNAVLKADDGRLPAADAAEFATAVKDAIAKATTTAPVTSTTPATSTTPSPSTLPATPALPSAPAPPTASATTLPAPMRHGDVTQAAPADVIGDALAALQKAVDELIKAVTSGDAAQVTPAVNRTVTSLVNTVAATLLAGKLPAPSLPGPPRPPSPATGGISYEDS
ncbi:hypothetical protein [Streptomyces sp. RP5T]|uniref:hypothetical protein n=1 Tax=Streptomyces sp. RP5T TaxID=2490848 RepID=UPI000F64B42C|nr:hypothetical protein [Streptomyces sp. RP5T]RRR75731.1 hypothetical protein EHS43_32345 [Streptomyces sp. RP5T]